MTLIHKRDKAYTLSQVESYILLYILGGIMLPSLYRFYLYTVFISMLLFATFGIQRLIQTLLAQTIFKDQYSTPGATDLVQAIVFAAVSLVTAVLFGGLHYWLIRRDMHNNPLAGSGGIR